MGYTDVECMGIHSSKWE